MEKLTGLELLSVYKNKIMERLIDDDLLVKAVANNRTDFKNEEVPDPGALLYKQIFPYKWSAPDIPTDKEVYITMSFAVDRLEGGVFNNVAFTIYVMVHKDIMRVETETDTMLRSDFIMSRIEKALNGSNDFGVGQLELVDTLEIFVNPLLPAFGMVFKTVDMSGRDRK